eukprot:scaffold24303_cov137-Cylindrotheca_fusiformis.AAC.4
MWGGGNKMVGASICWKKRDVVVSKLCRKILAGGIYHYNNKMLAEESTTTIDSSGMASTIFRLETCVYSIDNSARRCGIGVSTLFFTGDANPLSFNNSRASVYSSRIGTRHQLHSQSMRRA